MPGQSFRGFSEKVALVACGASGIGRAVALQLALEGAYVIVSYPEGEAEGERVAQELRELGTLAQAVKADVWRKEGVVRVFTTVEETFGRLDLLVNATHAAHCAALDDLTEEAWDEVFDLNLKSAFLCSQAATRLMRRRPKPAIVNVASEAGLRAHDGDAAYVASQAGLIGLTKALARSLAPRIRVNCVAVAFRDSETLPQEAMNSQSQSAHGVRPAVTPLPDEVARACVYLLSTEAGTITGQTLVVGEQF